MKAQMKGDEAKGTKDPANPGSMLVGMGTGVSQWAATGPGLWA